MEDKLCKYCNGVMWHEVDPQYEDDTMSELFYYLECSRCRAQTESFPSEEQAVEAWKNGEYTTHDMEDKG